MHILSRPDPFFELSLADLMCIPDGQTHCQNKYR